VLPPGPKTHYLIQTLAALTRQRPYLERQRRRFGDIFTIRVYGIGPIVMVSDPALIKQVFTADPKVLHAGEGSPLKFVLGSGSLLVIDEDTHMRQRKLLLPSFHGKRMKEYEQLIARIAAEEIDAWPEGREFPVAKTMQRITLRAILEAVFGASGRELQELERLIPSWTERGSRLMNWRFAHHDWGPLSPWGRFLRQRAEIDGVLDTLIDKARRDPALEDRADVLALLVQARDEDGAPMTDEEIRDQLMTLLAAGHETTAWTLCWAVERLRRHPDVLRALAEEADAGGSTLREATVREVQRTRPVVHFSSRLTKEPYELGGHELPADTRIALAAVLTHSDERLFEDPTDFRPQRFTDAKPDTYSWIPFGGGIRRCIGAAFAHMEMDVVLRTILERYELLPTDAPPEGNVFRGVTFAPSRGGLAAVRRRAQAPVDTGAAESPQTQLRPAALAR
jgi:cytochrome P450